MTLSSTAAAVIAFVGTAPAAVGFDPIMSEPVRLALWGIVLLALSRTIRGRLNATAADQSAQGSPVDLSFETK